VYEEGFVLFRRRYQVGKADCRMCFWNAQTLKGLGKIVDVCHGRLLSSIDRIS
jgi:hypothetical protein